MKSMFDPNTKSWGERVEELLDDADNPSVSDDEYERRREELDREAEERKAQQDDE